MKKLVSVLVTFIIYTIVVNACPQVTVWDKSLLSILHSFLAPLPLIIPSLMDEILYAAMIIIPFLGLGIYFLKTKKFYDLVLFYAVPLICFLLNSGFKEIIQRPRPPFELQQVIKLTSYSYTSTHSLVMFCLWGMVIFYAYKYNFSKPVKNFLMVFTILWVLFVGLSRMWLGVHYFTDVIGGFILGIFFLLIFIKISNKFQKVGD
ncbi:MAG: phosphatase PAP2 family protein [Cyanobacteria bacterium SIG29]|nr:phosphatase PAP2 family protein [Cyanobacteria bacterium SIG29]